MRAVAAFTLAVALIAQVRAGSAPLQRFEAVQPHMGTLVRVTVYTAGEEQADEAFRAAFDRIGELEQILSDYRPGSELNTIARTAVGRQVAVSPDLWAVLHASQELAAATGGAFDVTQGPVVRLWRDARKTGIVPAADALAEASARSGFRRLRLHERTRSVSLAVAGMALDVGGIGKGYAASEAIAVLRRRGVSSALVAISGDLAFSDAPPGTRGWRIRVHDGESPLDGIPPIVELANAAASTSGNAEQHLDAGGRRYSHIIDPASSIGLVDDVTVTVIAPHGLESDGLDTAASVLGVQRGLALVESRRSAAALFVTRKDGARGIVTSSRFRAVVAGPPLDLRPGG